MILVNEKPRGSRLGKRVFILRMMSKGAWKHLEDVVVVQVSTR